MFCHSAKKIIILTGFWILIIKKIIWIWNTITFDCLDAFRNPSWSQNDDRVPPVGISKDPLVITLIKKRTIEYLATHQRIWIYPKWKEHFSIWKNIPPGWWLCTVGTAGTVSIQRSLDSCWLCWHSTSSRRKFRCYVQLWNKIEESASPLAQPFRCRRDRCGRIVTSFAWRNWSIEF